MRTHDKDQREKIKRDGDGYSSNSLLGALLLAPVNTRIFTADLPDVKTLPPGRYLVRAILDIGLDHYIGVQKELDVTSANLPPSTVKPKQD